MQRKQFPREFRDTLFKKFQKIFRDKPYNIKMQVKMLVIPFTQGPHIFQV